jgi:hypothetical protein
MQGRPIHLWSGCRHLEGRGLPHDKLEKVASRHALLHRLSARTKAPPQPTPFSPDKPEKWLHFTVGAPLSSAAFSAGSKLQGEVQTLKQLKRTPEPDTLQLLAVVRCQSNKLRCTPLLGRRLQVPLAVSSG